MSIESSGAAKRRPFLARCLDRFRSAVARWNEVQRLDSREMEAIAHELNLSKAELNALIFAPLPAPAGRSASDFSMPVFQRLGLLHLTRTYCVTCVAFAASARIRDAASRT